MKLQDFHVEIADWSRQGDREALQAIRQQVFVVGQNVPEARERDGLDPDCWHVLARDEQNQPIGCARLESGRKIGRMAVIDAWRSRGVGTALLRELLTRARAQGSTEVVLSAQLTAQRFYANAGFAPVGEVFEDAGLAHQSMRVVLPSATVIAATAPPIGNLPASGREETAAARLRLLVETRHRLALRLPLLGSDSYASTDELDQLRRIAISGRAAQIRILLHDPEAALRADHRLITLAQYLNSAIQIRQPLDEMDLGYPSSVLLNDRGGYLFLPEADRPQGRAALTDRSMHGPLLQQFDETWERSERARVLQVLNI